MILPRAGNIITRFLTKLTQVLEKSRPATLAVSNVLLVGDTLLEFARRVNKWL
jgi:hypothetical protein